MRRHGEPELLSTWAAGRLGRRGGGTPEVVFAQVREDVGVEVAALGRCPRSSIAFCIASGGCTALSLLTEDVAAVDAVDINAAQVHLLELKRAAIAHIDGRELRACFTLDGRPAYPEVRGSLSVDARRFWDARVATLDLGLNRCGRLEQRLMRATRAMTSLYFGRRRIEALFSQSDIASQRAFYRRHWDTWRWRLLFRIGLSRPILRLFYGNTFLRALPADFPAVIRRQVDAAFLGSPVRENGYLWQAFRGEYPPGDGGLPLYLQPDRAPIVRSRLDRLRPAVADAASWLEAREPATLGFFALSNILEVTTPDYQARLMRATLRAAVPGALVCLRSLLPPIGEDLTAFPAGLTPEPALERELGSRDRSPFCRFLRIFRVNPHPRPVAGDRVPPAS